MTALRARSCLIDAEAVCCVENGLAVFALLRYRRRPAEIFLYAFDLLELDGQDPPARAAGDPQGDAGEPAARLRARAAAPQRIPRPRPGGRASHTGMSDRDVPTLQNKVGRVGC